MYIYSGSHGQTYTDEELEVVLSDPEYVYYQGEWCDRYYITSNLPINSITITNNNYDILYFLSWGKNCTVIENFDDYVSKDEIPEVIADNNIVKANQTLSIEVVSSMPASPDPNTMYLVTGS